MYINIVNSVTVIAAGFEHSVSYTCHSNKISTYCKLTDLGGFSIYYIYRIKANPKTIYNTSVAPFEISMLQ